MNIAARGQAHSLDRMRTPLLLAVLAMVPVCTGEAVTDPARAKEIIASLAGGKKAGLPTWIEDPTAAGAFELATYAADWDAGTALTQAIVELGRTRAVKIRMYVTEPGSITDTTSKATASAVTAGTSAQSFGALRVQSLAKANDTTGSFEVASRIVHPAFSIQSWSSESGEISAKGPDRRKAMRRIEWTANAPVSGADVAQACAAGGIIIAACSTMPDRTDASLWAVALAGPLEAQASDAYLLPLQAPAMVLIKALAAQKADILPGADVTRPEAGTLRCVWPQGQASLTVRLDREGRLLGLTAEQTITQATPKSLPQLLRESLETLTGPLDIIRSPAGEVWRPAKR
jgi:hypothetical protein